MTRALDNEMHLGSSRVFADAQLAQRHLLIDRKQCLDLVCIH
jgi:hypothetical protein